MAESATRRSRPALTSLSIAGRRSRNEDRALILSEEVHDGSVVLLVVADGMGGHSQGEVAAKLACKAFERAWPRLVTELESSLPGDIGAAEASARKFLIDTFLLADHRIGERVEKENVDDGMGTTLVAALSVHSHLLFANVGDSRGYLICQDVIEQITEDHSVVEDAMRRGMMSEAEANASVFRHALTRSIDGNSDAVPDLFPNRGWIACENGAVALLCSDGLYGPLTDFDLFEHVVRTPDIETAGRALLCKAIHENSQDNATIVGLELGHLPRAPDQLALSEKELSSILKWRAEDEDEQAESQWRLRIGRLSLAIMTVCFLIALLWTSLREQSSTRAESSGTIDISIDDGRPVNPTSLSWSLSGDLVDASLFTISVAGPPDSLTNQRPVVLLETRETTLPFSEIEAKWPGEPGEGEYRWSVSMLAGRDTLRSDVGIFSIVSETPPPLIETVPESTLVVPPRSGGQAAGSAERIAPGNTVPAQPEHSAEDRESTDSTSGNDDVVEEVVPSENADGAPAKVDSQATGERK